MEGATPWTSNRIWTLANATISIVYGLFTWIVTIIYGEGYGRFFALPVVTALTYGLHKFVENMWKMKGTIWGPRLKENSLYFLLIPSFETQISAMSTVLLLPYVYQYLTGWQWGWKRILATTLIPLTVLVPFLINYKFIPQTIVFPRAKFISLLSGALIGIGFGLLSNYLTKKVDTKEKPPTGWRNAAIGFAGLVTLVFFGYLFYKAKPKLANSL